MKRKQFTVTLPFRPKAKGRPRAGKYGMYTDKPTREHEARIRQAWVDAKGPLFTGPVTLEVTFHKDRIELTITECDDESSLRGDLDNYLKSLLDGLNGVAYNDDKQVLNLDAKKR